jgi:hypothetical protein
MKNEPASSISALCQDMFEELARSFPVSCSSDEFFYFPQVRLPEPDWSTWDNFSAETVADFARRLSNRDDEFERLKSLQPDQDIQIDISLHQKIARTLREQLSDVRTWESQPTFYLTLACIGLAEAMESEDPAAKHERAESLPAFLDQAGLNLVNVPLLFRDIGLEMVSDTGDYITFLGETLPELKHAYPALERFKDALLRASTREDFLLPRDLLERIFRFHISCEMDIRDVNDVLDQEIHEMRTILDEEARVLVPEQSVDQCSYRLWFDALENIPTPDPGKEGLVGCYRNVVEKLAIHCLKQGWISPEFVSSCPVHVVPMPDYLKAVRIASSYSIPPRHPPSGGKFYVIDANISDETRQENIREYRMLSAHETYPGHHLLDASRWSLKKPCRRNIEQPIFYEGWACFAEELMRLSGYFTGSQDRLLLAKRRLWRAMRGKVDIGLQTGTMDIPSAAAYLKETGITTKWAISSARRYPLNPGYQQCYTLGLRRFLNLFDEYGRHNLKSFVRTVLDQGEIGFTDLKKIFKNTSNRFSDSR